MHGKIRVCLEPRTGGAHMTTDSYLISFVWILVNRITPGTHPSNIYVVHKHASSIGILEILSLVVIICWGDELIRSMLIVTDNWGIEGMPTLKPPSPSHLNNPMMSNDHRLKINLLDVKFEMNDNGHINNLFIGRSWSHLLIPEWLVRSHRWLLLG